MKHYNQSKKAKEEFLRTSKIALIMSGEPERVYTREELAETLGVSDREVRSQVAELANHVAVVSLSKGKGYKVPTFDENTPIEKLQAMHDEVQHQINENKSRIDNIKARMKPLVALQKVLEKKLGN